MADRTITLSSIGKTFAVTGWKVGWAIASPDLSSAVRAAHQFLTFTICPALQLASAAALRSPPNYYETLRAQLQSGRDLLCDALTGLGFPISKPKAGYFVMADHTPFGRPDDVAFVKHLIEEVGVAAIPPSHFYADHIEEGRKLIRFAFCKQQPTLREAVTRLLRLRA